MFSQNPNKTGTSRRSQPPARPFCPRCGRSMTVRQVTPVMFAADMDEVVYGCADCGTEAKRTVKRG